MSWQAYVDVDESELKCYSHCLIQSTSLWFNNSWFQVYVESVSRVEERSRVRCAFCPTENMVPLATFLFLIARMDKTGFTDYTYLAGQVIK